MTVITFVKIVMSTKKTDKKTHPFKNISSKETLIIKEGINKAKYH